MEAKKIWVCSIETTPKTIIAIEPLTPISDIKMVGIIDDIIGA